MKRLLILLTLLVTPLVADAQGLRITLNVTANPSPYLSDWTTRKETAILTIVNSGTSSQDVKLGAKVYTDATLQAETRLDRVPTFTVRPGVNTFYGEDLVPAEAVKFYGDINTKVVRTGRLPSGSYRFCIRVFDAATQAPLSEEQCRPFTIRSYRGPQLLAPANGTTVPPPIIRQTLRWSDVSPRYSPRQEYQINVMEVLRGQTPIQAFRANRPILDRRVSGPPQLLWPPDVQLDTPMTYVWSVRALDNTGNPLGESQDGWAEPWSFSVGEAKDRSNERGRGTGTGDTFTAPVADAGRLIRSGGIPPGRRGTDGVGNIEAGDVIGVPSNGLTVSPAILTAPENPQPPPGVCAAQQSTCPQPECRHFAPYVFAAGDTLTICGFTMILDSGLTGSSGGLTGTGTIRVKWMGTNVAVRFDGISINDSHQICNGTVTALVDSSADTYPQQWAINAAGSFNWTKSQVKKLNAWLHNSPWKMKKLATLNVDSLFQTQTATPVKVPLGFNDVNGVTLAITEIKFEPTGAHLNMTAAFPVDLDLNDTLAFKGGGFAFGPNTPHVNTARLSLIGDVAFLGNVNSNQTYEITVKAEHGSTPGTFISWDCKGFRELNLDMEIAFPRQWLIPIPDNGGRVAARMVTNVVKWSDWLVLASLPRCAVANSNGLELEVSSMLYDHSDTRNVTGMIFPPAYTGDQSAMFNGFYLKSAAIVLPDKLRTFSDPAQPVKIFASDMIINKLGITGDVGANNLVNFPNGNIANLGASIDTVRISFVNSSLTRAYMRGRIVLPVSDPTAPNALLYKGLFNTGNGFQFTLQPTQPIQASMFAAAMLTIDPTSILTISLANGPAAFDLKLNGKFDWNDVKIGNTVKVSMRDVGFQNLKMAYNDQSGMTFNHGTWNFASPQKWLAKIPLKIDEIKFDMKPKQAGEVLRGALAFDVLLSLSENTISGRTRLEVEGAIEKPPGGKFAPKLVGVSVKEIEIHAKLAAVKIDGKAIFFKDDPTYGNGFSGTLKAVFNSIQMQIDASARFGSTEFQSPGAPYRYWGVEAKAILPKPGIVFLPGVAFYGFGAGAWKRMSVTNLTKPALTAVAGATTATASPTSGAVFTPNPNNGFGFKAVAVVGTAPEPKSFNGDAALLGEFSTSGGLTKIEFTLDAWVAAGLLERAKAPVWGTVSISYVPPTKVFDLNALVNVYYPRENGNIIKSIGNGVSLKLNINGSTGLWYFKLGEPNNLNTIALYNTFNVQEYLMFGNNIQAQTGFLPKTVEGLNQAGVGVAFQNQGISTQASMGQGFAAGLTVFGSTGSKTVDLGYRTKLKYGASGGFEVNLSMLRYPASTVCDGTPLGMNGWYATGGVAVWFAGYAGIEISPSPKDPWCCPCIGDKDHRCCNPLNCCAAFCGSSYHHIMDIKFGARLNGGFPNPGWANGQVGASYNVCGGLFSGSFNCNMQIGKQCNVPQPEPVPGVVAEDAAATINAEGTLIHAIHPATNANGFPPDNSIGVSMGFKPDDAFDVFERQADNTVKKRTFQARYVATLDSVGVPVSSVLQTRGNPTTYARGPALTAAPLPIVLQRSSSPNELGEYGYRIYRGGPTLLGGWTQNLSDNTRYRFTITGELWEKIGANWSKALRRNGQLVSETQTSSFSTGVSQRIGTGGMGSGTSNNE